MNRNRKLKIQDCRLKKQSKALTYVAVGVVAGVMAAQ